MNSMAANKDERSVRSNIAAAMFQNVASCESSHASLHVER